MDRSDRLFNAFQLGKHGGDMGSRMRSLCREIARQLDEIENANDAGLTELAEIIAGEEE